MSTSCWKEGVLFVENLSVITSEDEVDQVQIRELLLKKWNELSKELDGGTILFIGGMHGTSDGKTVGLIATSKKLMKQVRK